MAERYKCKYIFIQGKNKGQRCDHKGLFQYCPKHRRCREELSDKQFKELLNYRCNELRFFSKDEFKQYTKMWLEEDIYKSSNQRDVILLNWILIYNH